MNNINQNHLGGSDEDYCKQHSTEIEENKSDIHGLFQVFGYDLKLHCFSIFRRRQYKSINNLRLLSKRKG